MYFLALAVSCYLPPIYLFTDTFVLPKFYLLLLSVGCMGIWVALAKGRGWGLPKFIFFPLWDITKWTAWKKVSTQSVSSIFHLKVIMKAPLIKSSSYWRMENPIWERLNCNPHLSKTTIFINNSIFYTNGKIE